MGVDSNRSNPDPSVSSPFSLPAGQKVSYSRSVRSIGMIRFIRLFTLVEYAQRVAEEVPYEYALSFE